MNIEMTSTINSIDTSINLMNYIIISIDICYIIVFFTIFYNVRQ
jgi:hypothetical protein